MSYLTIIVFILHVLQIFSKTGLNEKESIVFTFRNLKDNNWCRLLEFMIISQ